MKIKIPFKFPNRKSNVHNIDNVIKIYGKKKGNTKKLKIAPKITSQSLLFPIDKKVGNLESKNLAKKTQRTFDLLPKLLMGLDNYLHSHKVLSESELSNYLANKAKSKITKKEQNKVLEEMYKEFIKRFIDIGELEENIIYHAWILNKKAVKILKSSSNCSYQRGENILIFSGCIYLSIKMLIDEEKWFIEDFSVVSDFDENIVEKMEISLLRDIFNFDYFIDSDTFQNELKTLKFLTVEKKKKMSFVIKRNNLLMNSFNFGRPQIKIHPEGLRKRGFSLKKMDKYGRKKSLFN